MLDESKTAPPTVIVVGPPASLVGGMAAVVEQVLTLDFGDHYRTVAFPTTFSPTGRESRFRQVVRHGRHLRRLAGNIRRSAASIIHVHTCSGFSFFRSVADMLVGQRGRCRVILHIHGAAFDEFHAGAGSLRRRLIAWSLRRADRVVALSEAWREKLRGMSPGANVTVIENAVSGPASVPSRRHDGPCRFLLLARMDEWKGVDDLLEACHRLHGEGVAVELVLAGPAGTAGDAAILDRRIHTLGLDSAVRYVGPVFGDDKVNLLRWADVYVQPSHNEGMPISLLEALSYGLPVVATRVGAVPEVLTDQREGLLVPAHRPDRLARAMGELIANIAHRETLGRAARDLASTRFGMDRFRRDLIALYDVLRAPPPRGEQTGEHSLAASTASTERRSSAATA